MGKLSFKLLYLESIKSESFPWLQAWSCPKIGIETQKISTNMEDESLGCPMCGKQFATKHNLNQHLRVHSGERPFACPVCGKGFKQKAHMQKHLSAHRNKEPLTGVLWMGNNMEDVDNGEEMATQNYRNDLTEV